MLVRIEVRDTREGGTVKLKECRASVRDKRINRGGLITRINWLITGFKLEPQNRGFSF